MDWMVWPYIIYILPYNPILYMVVLGRVQAVWPIQGGIASGILELHWGKCWERPRKFLESADTRGGGRRGPRNHIYEKDVESDQESCNFLKKYMAHLFRPALSGSRDRECCLINFQRFNDENFQELHIGWETISYILWPLFRYRRYLGAESGLPFIQWLLLSLSPSHT